jgi:hypothetical protein
MRVRGFLLGSLGVVTFIACGGGVRDDDTPKPTLGADAAPPPHPKPPPEPVDSGPTTLPSDFDTTEVADEAGGEVQLGVSPATGRIVVAWIGLGNPGRAEIRYAFSDDGGATWSPAASVGETVGDPVVAPLDDGTFLLGGLRANCTGGIDVCTDGELFLSKLAAKGSSLTPLPSVREPPSNAFIDHPWASVHGSDVSLIGAVFPLVSGNYQSGMTAWRSTDHGETWTRSEIVTASASAQIGIPRFCAGDGNRLWAHYYDGDSQTEGTLRYTDQADDGWTATNQTTAGDPQSGLATTGACVVRGDTVYALVGTDATPDPGGPQESVTPIYGDLTVHVSSDLGKTWKTLASITKPSMLYLLPEIDLEPDGTVDVFYYRGTAPDAAGTAEMARIDAQTGKIAGPYVVKDGLRFVNDRGSSRWLGDYNGIGYESGPIVAYGDNATIQTRIYFGRLKK